MKSDRPLPVAIVGGGFSGTMVAAQLARKAVESVLIEGGCRVGRGIAYSTAEPAHVLNVCAESMSAWADDPDHFARWFETQGGVASDFAQRRLFGRYLDAVLGEATATGKVRLVEQKAIAAVPNGEGWAVELADGEKTAASALVLATGNQPPDPLPMSDLSRFIGNPWSAGAHDAIDHAAATDADVLIIGTGLTMIDTVLSLDAGGHRGRIVAVSRRGLVPHAHADHVPAPVELDDVPRGNAQRLLSWLRERAAKVGWRAAIDALRPHSHAVWQALSLEEQRRFIRHGRPWWDVRRHRIAPEVSQRLHNLIAAGRLQIVAGRLAEVRECGDTLDVRISRRGGDREMRLCVAYAFNSTGPLHAMGRTRDPMLRQMLEDGLIKPDRLGIGLEVDECSRIAGSERAWAMGPLTKGRYWEIIAVPDISGQAAAVADDIAMELGR
jgi:uncharacterized NAD(P)/FAD-binding protein YdhS